MIALGFFKPDTKRDKFLMWLIRGKYSHVSIFTLINKDIKVYEATFKSGVRVKNAFDKTPDKLLVLEIEGRYEKKIKEFLNKQVGKKYDILGVLAFIFPIYRFKFLRRYWQGKWYCSELAQVIFMIAFGEPIKRVKSQDDILKK